MGRAAATHLGDVHQFSQDRIFQLELDAVDHCLEGNVDVEKIRVLCSYNGGVHQNHDYVHDQELDQGASVVASWTEIQEPYCFPGVNDGEDDFLYGEPDQLDTLKDVKPAGE